MCCAPADCMRTSISSSRSILFSSPAGSHGLLKNCGSRLLHCHQNSVMNDTRINILLIEDNPGDARLIERMLAQAQGLVFESVWVDNLTDGIAHLQTQAMDVLLLDLGLPESTGLDTLQRVLAHAPAALTLLVLSGVSDENIAVQAVQSGAQDYLVKGQV